MSDTDAQTEPPGAAVTNLRTERIRRIEAMASEQGGVVSRRQAYATGLTRAFLRHRIRSGRWQRVGSQSVAVHTGPLSEDGRHWGAVFEAGPRSALDGASALIAAGLKHFELEAVRVSVPRGARIRRRRRTSLDIRETRRWSADDFVPGGVPRTRPAVAAVRAAVWARSDKQAALLLSMTVQQGLATPEQLAGEFLRIRWARRRGFIGVTIVDLLGGVRALSELEFARECRARGLPEPTRQVRRQNESGTWILDVLWEKWGVVVEVDGIQHSWAGHVVRDALRQNSLALTAHTVLRLPLLGLRVAPDEFFAQIERALLAAGCPGIDRTA